MCFRDHALDLQKSLDEAVNGNRFQTGRNGPQRFQLDGVIRVSPLEYRTATVDIAEALKQGRVVSIDFSAMQAYEAARLADFCNGLAVISGSWIFRMAENVIVITHES
ncbi:cell division protein SepF [Micromonospora chersina]